MNEELSVIFGKENQKDYEGAFESYNKLYDKNRANYEVWKHFYFFLWISLEDAPEEFCAKIKAQEVLKSMLNDGKMLFSDLADFNFIAGYTMAITPYEFGEYDIISKEGNLMLLHATELSPQNKIYYLAFIRNITQIGDSKNKQAALEAAPAILEEFNNYGFLNQYFRSVFYDKL